MLQNFHTKEYLYWILFSVVVLSLLGYFTIELPPHGDERHFVETIRSFSASLNFGMIKDYPETTPPLFYVIGAIWAKIFNDSLESLRIFNLLISFVTWQCIYLLLNLFSKNRLHTFLLSLLVVLNPYFLGLSVFVFTDMITIMFGLLAVISLVKEKYYLFILLSTLAILCRQYAIIFPLSAIVFWAAQRLTGKRIAKLNFAGAVLSILPLLILFSIWGDIAPAAGVKKWIVKNDDVYNISYINTYLTFTIFYISPLFIILLKKTKLNFIDVLAAVVLSVILSFFPISPSKATLVQTDYNTVGYAHLYLVRIFGENTILLKFILGLFLLGGCYFTILLLKVFFEDIKNQQITEGNYFTLVWLIFLILMPFSYQVWEKYLTIVLPYIIINLFLLLNRVELQRKFITQPQH